jgi:hypothetical protein
MQSSDLFFGTVNQSPILFAIIALLDEQDSAAREPLLNTLNVSDGILVSLHGTRHMQFNEGIAGVPVSVHRAPLAIAATTDSFTL